MSFSFGISDFIAVLTLVNKIRKRFVDAPEQFRAISDEVKSLTSVLRNLEDSDAENDIELSERQRSDLQEHLKECKNVFEDLDSMLDKYVDLDSSKHSGTFRKTRRFCKRLQ